MGKVMGKADVVTTPTPLAAKAMHQHAFLRKVLPLSNGIDSSAYELRPGEDIEPHGHPTVLFVGRLAEEKHVDVLIDAVAKTPRELNVHLEIVGGGEVRPALEAQVAKPWAWADRVRFLGLASDEDLRRRTFGRICSACPGPPNCSPWSPLRRCPRPPRFFGQRDGPAAPGARRRERAPVHPQTTAMTWPPRSPSSSDCRRTSSKPWARPVASMVEPHSINSTLQTFEDLYRGAAYEDKVI